LRHKVNDDAAHCMLRRWRGDDAEGHENQQQADIDRDRERKTRRAAPKRLPVIGRGKAISGQV
jgi:hypothetical protein